MHFTVANHNDAKNSKGFINYDDVEFSDIPKMVMSGYAYSAGKFKDNHRKNDNWEGCEDVLILDIDDGCNIKQAMSVFSKYQYFIITSRSHQKEKNGFVCDRFRVFINLESTINDKDIRDKFMREIMNTFYFVDASCKDRGRFFYSSPDNANVYYNEGKKMQVIVIEHVPQQKEQPNDIINTSDNIYRLCELSGLWVDTDGNTLESGYSEYGLNIESKIKGAIKVLDNEFYSGNRNHALFKTTKMLLNDGLNEDDVANFILKENEKRGGLPFKEVMTVIKSALR